MDTGAFRKALGTFATGVTVVTVGGEKPHGMTANSFTGVSLDPPLILLCVGREAFMHDALKSAKGFAVSILASHQEYVARWFADRQRPLGAAQFDAVDWTPGEITGAPLISGAAAHFECELYGTCDGGDHTIFLGELARFSFVDRDSLLFHHGRFSFLESGVVT